MSYRSYKESKKRCRCPRFESFQIVLSKEDGDILHILHDKKLLKDVMTAGEDALVLIGPEGDFSEEEVEMAIKFGFVPISLGPSRLRTETAALVACLQQ